MKHLSNHILKLILAVSALIVCANCYADEITKTHKKESCGFEWIKVNYQGKVGAQTASGDWIVPLRNNQTIFFSNFEKEEMPTVIFMSSKIFTTAIFHVLWYLHSGKNCSQTEDTPISFGLKKITACSE